MDKGAQNSGSPSPLSQRCSGGLGKGDNAQVTAIPSGLPAVASQRHRTNQADNSSLTEALRIKQPLKPQPANLEPKQGDYLQKCEILTGLVVKSTLPLQGTQVQSQSGAKIPACLRMRPKINE